jgi:hypothetical protein
MVKWAGMLAAAAVLFTPPSALAKSAYQAEAEALFADWLEDEGIAGGVLLIAAPDERYVVAAGLANTETGEPCHTRHALLCGFHRQNDGRSRGSGGGR